jgi:hypothetical protein
MPGQPTETDGNRRGLVVRAEDCNQQVSADLAVFEFVALLRDRTNAERGEASASALIQGS